MGNAAFLAGVNLGGWLSQYRVASDEHLSTFITERDIATIASWGLDHVRLPVDYPIVEDDAAPGQYREQGLAYIDRCIEWCERHGLGVVLDLHHAPGYSFGRLETNNLFESEQQLGRFVGIWKMFAQRYRSVGEHLRMELLNEVVEPTSERWNGLAHRTIAAIRAIDQQRTIVYGGNNRTTMLRVPGPGRFENRAVDSACNPYLALAGMIAAGLDGVERGLDPGAPVQGAAPMLGVESMPRTLTEALDELERDVVLRDGLGEEALCELVAVKRMEWSDYMEAVTDWEQATYLRRV